MGNLFLIFSFIFHPETLSEDGDFTTPSGWNSESEEDEEIFSEGSESSTEFSSTETTMVPTVDVFDYETTAESNDPEIKEGQKSTYKVITTEDFKIKTDESGNSSEENGKRGMASVVIRNSTAISVLKKLTIVIYF
ncbi:hypothetical protein AB6A40_004216 [Gnathostoma spinigerum]|uniref:Uncharacterized protein n=1 Tax=Gnathostoma spinigerum TaxID=75299 RepID=A0ABD6ELB7_9BILA